MTNEGHAVTEPESNQSVRVRGTLMAPRSLVPRKHLRLPRDSHVKPPHSAFWAPHRLERASDLEPSLKPATRCLAVRSLFPHRS